MTTDFFEPGKKYELFGVDGNCFKIGDRVLEATEDPSDGYRSYLGSIEVKDPTGLIFFGKPIARVQIIAERTRGRGDYADGFDGYFFRDADGWDWLIIGTNNCSDWYPSFHFEWRPRSQDDEMASLMRQHETAEDPEDRAFAVRRMVEMDGAMDAVESGPEARNA